MRLRLVQAAGRAARRAAVLLARLEVRMMKGDGWFV